MTPADEGIAAARAEAENSQLADHLEDLETIAEELSQPQPANTAALAEMLKDIIAAVRGEDRPA